MAEAINPISAEIKLAQILGNDYLSEAPQAVMGMAEPNKSVEFTGNPFEDVLARAIDSLEGISRSEISANQLIDKYLKGEVELPEVMLAQSKMSIIVQLAVTTINSAVASFKELTQMQV
ncbi:hypothetical protein A3H38_00985 [candidate division WOR-1 bacterium RIFCSPLOWO2_02_FULL_46_20]|uniref:Flagellar hook-basal body complex protein FliE n=2 Tax=Saganbacteria TaxID=1703751 RepID=A0A1F4RDK8_UNCSA|nr:MAG: hypothetical protein A3J44_01430 [candidate division WOR-1 bacterium RIFCSPHIGHO2_02_FULL_45_12]OGC06262.1 MAG: hypothetical protein A3H38_00985 [candidate division WOR-1 bacterium RIFCSPLOWO2_02_FULL_46_20]OGC08631.1 MAG: hypothetical protein A3F86_01170 [candidate division WOR-1 bacterium RIFCSPLOWO2_12_FULL_45_9]